MNDIKNYDELAKKIQKALKSAVTESRYEHSLRTAQMCKRVCKIYSLDFEKGYIAGLAHDLCKKCSDKELFELALQDGKEISEIEKLKPSLLHGRAAAVKIQKEFSIHDSQIIQAIACHTFGGKGICDLAKALYVSDKIEPAREQVSTEYYSRLFALDFNKMVYQVLLESVEYLTKKGKKISSVTLEFLQELEHEIGE